MDICLTGELDNGLTALGLSAPPNLVERMRGCKTEKEISDLADLVEAYQHGYAAALAAVRTMIGESGK